MTQNKNQLATAAGLFTFYLMTNTGWPTSKSFLQKISHGS
jgi:hypothetical protein